MEVREYIRLSWDKSLRERGHRADGIGLPYKYNSPCAQGIFDEFYYWDTAFIDKGLIADGKIGQALCNVRNMAYLINKYGFMPNAAVEGMLDRSQPPLFAMACGDIVRAVRRKDTAESARLEREFFPALEREYSFWMKNRILTCGLNRYGNQASVQSKWSMAAERENRLGLVFDRAEWEREKLGDDTLAECESGWDFSPRFSHRCTEYAPVDLNCILYLYEKTLAAFSADRNVGADYIRRSELRKERMREYCFNGKLWLDGRPKEKTFSSTVSAASALPYFAGIDDDAAGLREVLSRLECARGIAACERTDEAGVYQWGYPNMWAPLVWFVHAALSRLELTQDAERIAEKYLSAVEACFYEEGKLWEKYDAVTGGKATVNEYAETEMLGWTAGVYCELYDGRAQKRRKQ